MHMHILYTYLTSYFVLLVFLISTVIAKPEWVHLQSRMPLHLHIPDQWLIPGFVEGVAVLNYSWCTVYAICVDGPEKKNGGHIKSAQMSHSKCRCKISQKPA